MDKHQSGEAKVMKTKDPNKKAGDDGCM